MQLLESRSANEDLHTAALQEVQHMAANGRDALMLVDGSGRCVHVNEEWLLLSGREAEEIVGKPACDGPVARDCEALDLLRHTLGDGVGRKATVYLRHQRGFQLKLSAQVTPISGGGDDISGFVIRMCPLNG